MAAPGRYDGSVTGGWIWRATARPIRCARCVYGQVRLPRACRRATCSFHLIMRCCSARCWCPFGCWSTAAPSARSCAPFRHLFSCGTRPARCVVGREPAGGKLPRHPQPRDVRNTPGPLQLHPDLANYQERREGELCRPLAVTPGEVEPVWRALAACAAAIGLPVPEPAPTTAFRTCRCSPKPFGFARHREHGGLFVYPAGTLTVGAPVFARCRPRAADAWECKLAPSRRYGRSLRLRHGGRIKRISLNHPRLDHGWWQLEIHAGVLRRWTDGDVLIPLPAVSSQSVLEVSVAASLEYPVIEAATRPKLVHWQSSRIVTNRTASNKLRPRHGVSCVVNSHWLFRDLAATHRGNAIGR